MEHDGLDTAPQLDRCYVVVKYRKRGAERILKAAGCDPSEARTRSDILPDRFPMICRADTGRPILAPTMYMLRRWRRPKPGAARPRSLNTAWAQAYDITDFLEHLDAYGLGYETVTQESFELFVENQARAPSMRTGRPLMKTTIARRLAHVASFLGSKEFESMGEAKVDRSLVSGGGRLNEAEIHPLTVDEWKQLAPHLGPLPSERLPGETSVLRLLSEWSLLTGARRVELLGLTCAQIFETSDQTSDAKLLTLKITKGGVARPLWVHPDVLSETLVYIAGERAEIMRAPDDADHDQLFVNPKRSGRHAAAPVRPDSLTKWFRAAAIAAGIRRRTISAFSNAGSFVFHDLRHTFAVWTYVALDLAGRKRPWKIIQARLGHKTLETTERVYLAFIEDHEVEISELLRKHVDKWIGEENAAL